ncbi:SERAC1 [Seiridium cupressi]
MRNLVLRVRQLPPHLDRSDAVQLVSKALGVALTAISIHSLAHSVNSWILTKTATLIFNDAATPKEVLQDAKRSNITQRGDEWNIKLDSFHHELNELIIDTHFRGLTPLHDPTNHVTEISYLQEVSLFWGYETKTSPTVAKLKNILSLEALTSTRKNGMSTHYPTTEGSNGELDGAGVASESGGLSHEDVYKSLHAPERDHRLEQIERKFRNTFDWVYDQSESRFSDWLQTESGLFWINGKQGPGKSTLMKFIFQDKRTSDLLHSWNGDGMTRVAFFFHYRGTTLQKSFEDLLRSILSQIISKYSRLCGFLQHLFDHSPLNSDDWTLQKLQKGFHEILEQSVEPLRLCLFIDALDEYDGPLEFICNFPLKVGSIKSTTDEQVKICFSSRPWNIFVDHFRGIPGFSIQEFTTTDIWDYCLGTIKGERLSTALLEELLSEIVERSRDVFLFSVLSSAQSAELSKTATLLYKAMLRQNAPNFSAAVRQHSRTYCGGLIEVLGQVLHQTVEDFVHDPKFKRSVLGDRARITVENGNIFLAKGRFVSEATKLPEIQFSVTRSSPYISYAAISFNAENVW